MVYRTNSPTAEAPGISLTRDRLDLPQRVTANIHGFDIPGEVIFADLWQPWFGAALPDRVMFSLVLLTLPQRVDRADVTNQSTIVAVPAPGLVTRDVDQLTQMHREVARLNEIREQYLGSTDNGLQRLATSLSRKVSEASVEVTRAHVEQCRNGQVVVASDNSISTHGDALFVGDDPQEWAEATAAAFFSADASRIPGVPRVAKPSVTFDALAANVEQDWRSEMDDHLRLFTGSGIEDTLERISALFSAPGKRITGDELRNHLIKERGIPPGLAWLSTVAFVRSRTGEAAVARGDQATGTRLNSHTVSSFSYQPDMIYAIDWLSATESPDWPAALPYIRALTPHMEDTGAGPTRSQETQLLQALETAESRFSLAVQTLRSAVGRPIESVSAFRVTEQLVGVLKGRNWQEFLVAASTSFPDAKQFTEAVRQASRLRSLAEDILDVRSASEYISMADFGRADHSLASEAELLRVRLDINDIVEGQVPALSVLHDFQQWRRRYSNVYRTFHAERRHANQLMSREVRRADAKLDALRKLVALPALELTVPATFDASWADITSRVTPCSTTEDSLPLVQHPYCTECGVRLGAPESGEEVEAAIADITAMIRSASIQFSRIAAERILSGQRENDLQKLIQMNSIADLTAISDILDPGVLNFLEQFAADQPGESRQ